MENKPYYHYTFAPQKLKEQRTQVEKTFRDVDQAIAKQVSHSKLPRLLEQIRKVPFDSLDSFARELKRMEVLVLLYDYPFPNESHETRRKINLILSYRYSAQVGKTAWGLFQKDPHEVFLQDLLRLIYNVDQFEFVVTNEKIRETIRIALLDRAGIVTGLIGSMISSTISTKEQINHLKIQQDVLLEKELLKGIFLKGLAKPSFVQRDGVNYITEKLERFEMDEYKELLTVYVEFRSFKEFEYAVMNQAIKRLGNPLEKAMQWDFLTPTAMEQIQKWLLQNKLKQFFEQDENNTRFDYWKNYLNQDHILDVDVIKEPKAAFIYFNRFVVVEFGIMGAAYFYHKQGFEEIIKPLSNSYKFRNSGRAKREDMLKRRYTEENGIPLFIDKHDHRGNWQPKFTQYMRNYLDGRF
ncbi:hypothetical protein [Paenibacillus andongensis]|uniref:hypothetical protein n=1 Tax=Paenibacillus andongensis TaxID=2975482 RepID=UPI0021BB8609|nr:hypothetical protein [Paenibacillus andongensis]